MSTIQELPDDGATRRVTSWTIASHCAADEATISSDRKGRNAATVAFTGAAPLFATIAQLSNGSPYANKLPPYFSPCYAICMFVHASFVPTSQINVWIYDPIHPCRPSIDIIIT
jgi:hypothetical protein